MDREHGPETPPVQPPPQRTGTHDVDSAASQECGAGSGLRFTVLGPVRVVRDGEALPSGSPQQRALLAALLLREGGTATAAELIDGIWGERPPTQALAALRTYASRLRKVLPADALVSESGGYALRIPPGSVDLPTARGLADRAGKARAAGDRGGARELLARSLEQWDGEPLASVPGPYAETQRARLAEWRLTLLETRLELDLECGRHAGTVSELTALTAAHPLRERLRELLMLALYRGGRQAEALAVYADTRRLLAEELGVDPGPELARLQERILRADEELARSAEESAPYTGPTRPAQLPAAVPDFTGRAPFVRELGARLAGGAEGTEGAEGRGGGTGAGSVMAVSALAGIGGVGKTTLAVHVAHAARPGFPDGQLYVDLQGAGPRPAEPEVVLGAFLRALGTADTAVPDGLEERAALYRSTLAGRRVLVLLDNARDAAQVRPLLPGTAGCAALVTSRVRMVDLAGAYLVDLDVMAPDEALQLFTRIVGAERVGAEREASLDVVAACGFLPLAIRIAASRLAARRTWTVSALAAKLADERRRLDELRAGDLAVKATFELGYGQLEPAQARAFRLLGLADGPDVSLAAAAAMLDLPAEEAEELLESLVDASLLESAAPGRYRFHDLVRLFARSCAETGTGSGAGAGTGAAHGAAGRPEGAAALDRLLGFYLATAARVYAIERPGDRLVDRLEPAGYAGLDFDDRYAAMDWLYAEAHCLLACARQSCTGAAAEPERLRPAVDLLWAAQDLAESGANAQQYEAAAVTAREAARAAGDARAEGRARTALTNVHLVAGRYDEADEEARAVRRLAVASGDAAPVYWSDNDRGIIALNQGRYPDAEELWQRARDGARADGNASVEASAVCNLSRLHGFTERRDSAVQLAREGIALYRRIGSDMRLDNARYALGVVLSHGGRYAEALVELTEAAHGFGRNRQWLWQGTAYFRIAEAQLASRRAPLAAQHAEEALSLGCIGGDRMRGNVLTVLGRALDALGQSDRARACWQEALALYERLGAPEADRVRTLLTPLAAA